MIARHFTPDKLVDKGLTLIKKTCDGLNAFKLSGLKPKLNYQNKEVHLRDLPEAQ